MLNSPDHVLLQFDTLNLIEIIGKPTRYDSKHLGNAFGCNLNKYSRLIPYWMFYLMNKKYWSLLYSMYANQIYAQKA